SAIMLLPGFGEQYVAPRIRLGIALAFSVALTPVIQGMPPVPDTTLELMRLIMLEILVGLFLGTIARMLIGAVHVAGITIAYQSSLSASITAGITQFSGQDSSIGNFLGVTAVVLIF